MAFKECFVLFCRCHGQEKGIIHDHVQDRARIRTIAGMINIEKIHMIRIVMGKGEKSIHMIVHITKDLLGKLIGV